MKKLFFTTYFFIVSVALFAQSGSVPPFINYQAVLRDANNTVLQPGTIGTLRFKLFDSLAAVNPSYVEDHNFTTNSVGIINLKIGTGTIVNGTIQGLAWSAGKVSYEVYLDNSSTPISPKQQFASVPYAVYALSSGGGNSLQNGIANQTLFWDGSAWKPTSILSNDGTNVGIGVTPSIGKNKLSVWSVNSGDSATFVSVRLNGGPKDAAVRGAANGIAAYNSNTTIARAFNNIYGGDFIANNNGTGFGVGVSGIGSSSLGLGTAIGVSGIASGPPSSTLIGLYGSVNTSSLGGDAYAAVFDKGKVSFNDELIFPAATATAGAVFTLDAQKKGYWSNASASSPPAFTSSGIGTITASAYPNYILNIPPPSLSITGNSISIIQGSFVTTQTISSLTGAGTLGYIPLYSGSSTFSISNIYRNLSNQIGINTNNPKTFFHLFKALGQDTMLLEAGNSGSMVYALKNSLNKYFISLSGSNLKIQEGNIDRMTFAAGNVGVGNPSPKNKLSVAGSMAVNKVTISNNYNVTPNDYIIESTSATTITLVNSTLVDEGTLLVIRNRSGATITINSVATDYIQRLGTAATSTTTSLPLYQVLRLYKSGTGWIEM